MIAWNMRNCIRFLMVVCGLLVACVGLGGVYSGCAFADECKGEFYDLMGESIIHYRQHPCEIAVNEICRIWLAQDVALRARIATHNARCPGKPEKIPVDPRNNRYQQQPLQQHHQQAHPPKEVGAGAGKIQSYEQAIKLVEKYPVSSKTAKGGKVTRLTRLVPSEQELLAIEKHLTQGLTPQNINTDKGIVQLYWLKDKTKISVRAFSNSGGRTLDIIPPKNAPEETFETRLHIH